MKRLISLALLFFSLQASAGFSVAVTQSTNTTKAPLMNYGLCFMTVGMAIASASTNNITVVDSITENTWTAHGTGFTASGTFVPCSSNAISYLSPSYAGGSADPGITSSGQIAGSGGTTSPLDYAALTTSISQGVTNGVSTGVSQGINGTATATERFQDGLTLGWGLGLVLIVAFGIRMFQRGF